jgi:hypothetical protein
VIVFGAQDPHARGVEGGHPHQPGARADQRGHPLLHLAGRLVGERDRDDLARVDVPLGQQVRDPVGQHPGLAGAGTGHDEQRRTGVHDRLPLWAVQADQQGLGVDPPGRRTLRLRLVRGRRGGRTEGQLGVFRKGSHLGVKSIPGVRQHRQPRPQSSCHPEVVALTRIYG